MRQGTRRAFLARLVPGLLSTAVACFGDIKPVGKVATVDAGRGTGECPALGFIVCN